MGLSRDEVDLFHNNGYLKLPVRLPVETVAELREAILRQVNEAVEPVVRNKAGRVVRLSKLYERGGVFQRVIADEGVLDCLESILSTEIMLTLNRHNHATLRTADAGGAMAWHRDVSHWTRNIVTALFYVEDAPIEKGCTHVVPGTHKLRYIANAALGADAFVTEGLTRQAVPVPAEAGEVLLINSLVLHCVGENRTRDTRISVTAGYHDADELYGAGNDKCVVLRGQPVYQGNDGY